MRDVTTAHEEAVDSVGVVCDAHGSVVELGGTGGVGRKRREESEKVGLIRGVSSELGG